MTAETLDKRATPMRPTLAFNQHREAIRAIGLRNRVTNLRVFGSVLHGTDTESSDLDLLVDPTPATSMMNIAPIEASANTSAARRRRWPGDCNPGDPVANPAGQIAIRPGNALVFQELVAFRRLQPAARRLQPEARRLQSED